MEILWHDYSTGKRVEVFPHSIPKAYRKRGAQDEMKLKLLSNAVA